MKGKINAKDRLIFALDVPDLETAIPLLDELEGKIGMVKVNSLAAACPEIVSIVQERKIGVWRDWKHKDIPGTVKSFIKADVEADLVMTTVHADGGIKMMAYAAEGAKGSNLKILAVTVLTSIDQNTFNEELGVSGEIVDKVVRYALNAEYAGLDGVVASAQEAKMLRENLDLETLIVTPGIKPTWAAKRKDQARVTTPYEAIMDGASHLVVGSAIRKAKEYNRTPGRAAEEIVAEIDKSLADRSF
ncbi:MAG: orotidine-5'-phosphate decarboxylase [Acidobacteriota bacterium]|nr:orotidine-5'-phosphate decarboxylase [Acidobacteriota bacterium]